VTIEGEADLPVGAALLLGAYLVAQHIANHEPAGETQQRMENALSCLAQNLREAAPEFFVVGQIPELSALADRWRPDDSVRLLVELRVADAFYPFQFEMTKSRGETQRAALREIARGALRIPGAADKVGAAWDEVRRAEKSYLRRLAFQTKLKNPRSWLAAAGVGAAFAGAAVAAAPAIAVLMPAAAGLSGAAAVSAGLAQLGFGSIAAGGLGMVGGVWVLGASAGAVGTLSASTATLLAKPGSAALISAEVRKLLVTFILASDGTIQSSAETFARGLDTMVDDVDAMIELEESRNEHDSARLRELGDLKRTLEFGGEFMASRDGLTPSA
jgi:hypothetical protein